MEFSENLEKLASHLDVLCSQIFKDLVNSEDDRLRFYAKEVIDFIS